MTSLLLALWLAVLPKNEILVKGATPAASDASTPVPEQGSVAEGRYRNRYFGLSYPIPVGWTEQPAGPPPSDGGSYVLTQFAATKATVLVTAQDLFFSARRVANAKELLVAVRGALEPQYAIDGDVATMTIAGRTFHRLAYRAPRSGLRWRILTTDARCHALTFTFMGNDDATLDLAERAFKGLSLSGDAPACVANYAPIVKSDPVFTTHRFNTIPVRVLVDANGAVKHVHLLSAFPEQTQAILTALREWKFPSSGSEVETGFVFGR